MTQKQQVKTRASKKENNIGGIKLQMHLYDQITLKGCHRKNL